MERCCMLPGRPDIMKFKTFSRLRNELHPSDFKCSKLSTKAFKHHWALRKWMKWWGCKAWHSDIKTPCGKMIRLCHYPAYLIRIYSTSPPFSAPVKPQRTKNLIYSSLFWQNKCLCCVCVCVHAQCATWSSPQPFGALTVTAMARRTLFQHCSRQPSNSITVAPQWSE